MNLTIQLTAETKRMLDELARDKKRFGGVTKKAASSASRAMFTTIQRTIRSERPMKIAEVKRLVESYVNIENATWTIRVNGDPVRVSKTKHRQVKTGVKFQPRKGKWALIEGGFVATMPGGHKGVFKRVEGQTRRKRIILTSGKRSTSELPIRERFTSGIAAVFLDESNRSAVHERGKQVFHDTLARLIGAGELAKK